MNKVRIAVSLLWISALSALFAQGGGASRGITLGRKGQEIGNAQVYPELGHSGAINSLSWSRDGTMLASSSDDNTIKIWNTESGREIQTINVDYNYAVLFCADSKHVVSYSYAYITIWDIESAKSIYVSPPTRPAALSPDSQTIAVLAQNENNGALVIQLYDTPTAVGNTGKAKKVQQIKSQLAGGDSSSNNLRLFFESDTSYIIASYNDIDTSIIEGIEEWNIATGEKINSWYITSSKEIPPALAKYLPVNDIIFIAAGEAAVLEYAPLIDGTRSGVAAGFDTGSILILDWKTGNVLKSLKRQVNTVHRALKRAGSAGEILSVQDDNTIRLWDTEGGRELRAFYYDDYIYTAQINDDGDYIATSTENSISIRDIADGQEILTHEGYAALFSPNLEKYITLDIPKSSKSTTSTINIHDTESGKIFSSFKITYSPLRALPVFSPDGKLLYIPSIPQDEKKGFAIYNVQNAKPSGNFAASYGAGYNIVFSGDGKKILTNSEFATVVWDADNGKEICRLSGTIANARHLSFSADGSRIIVVDSVYDAAIYDAGSGVQISAGVPQFNNVEWMEFSQDGEKLFSYNEDRSAINIINIDEGQEAHCISFVDDEWICITQDGYYNASTSGDKYLNVRYGLNVYGIDQYRATFYKADLFLDTEYTANISGANLSGIQNLSTIAPPVITVNTPASGSILDSGTARLNFSVYDANLSIRNIKVLVNGISAHDNNSAAPDAVEGFDANINLDAGLNTIEIIAFNGYSESKKIITVVRSGGAVVKQELPNLWLLAIGINQYDNLAQDKQLNYCVNDAREIFAAFRAQEGISYTKVNSLLIADGEAISPTAQNIKRSLSFLNSAAPRDVVILFIACHGVNDDEGNFYLLPKDAQLNSDGSVRQERAINNNEILSVLNAQGNRLLFIDACHSADVIGGRTRRMDNDRLARELQESNAVIFTASRGAEESEERADLEHGVFTYSILQGLRGEEGMKDTSEISMMSLGAFVSNKVKTLTRERQHPIFSCLRFDDFPIVRGRSK